MIDNFVRVTEWILIHEGGYVNHPMDPGGATNKGVTQRVYDSYKIRNNELTRSVKYIQMSEVLDIYKFQYWDKVLGDHLPNGLDYAMYDFAINSGPHRAVQFLQRILRVSVDGVMGNITLAAIKKHKSIEEVIRKLCFDRFYWLKTLSTFSTFGKGWTRRVMGKFEGYQHEDTGVIDRSVLLYRTSSSITPPLEIDDGANAKADADIKTTEKIKQSMNLENIAKVGTGAIPAIIVASEKIPEGPLQVASAIIVVLIAAIVGFVVYKKFIQRMPKYAT